MKELVLSPSPHVRVKIQITEQMQKDFEECKELDGKDCNKCSLKDEEICGIGVCEIIE